MIGGGHSDICISRSIAGRLFDDFESLDRQLRSLNPVQSDLVVKIGENEAVMKLSYGVIDGMDSYSRAVKTKEGQWITVRLQGIDWGFASIVRLSIFDERAPFISITAEDCKGGDIVFSKQAKVSKKDSFFLGALRAVTGKSFSERAVEK